MTLFANAKQAKEAGAESGTSLSSEERNRSLGRQRVFEVNEVHGQALERCRFEMLPRHEGHLTDIEACTFVQVLSIGEPCGHGYGLYGWPVVHPMRLWMLSRGVGQAHINTS